MTAAFGCICFLSLVTTCMLMCFLRKFQQAAVCALCITVCALCINTAFVCSKYQDVAQVVPRKPGTVTTKQWLP